MEFTIVPPEIRPITAGELEKGTVFDTEECPDSILVISSGGVISGKLPDNVIPVYNLRTLGWGVISKNHPVKNILGTFKMKS